MPIRAAELRPDLRLNQLHQWLAGLATSHRLDPDSLQTASADASARRYFRVASPAQACGSLIVMDAPPPEKCREFAQVAALMTAAGLHVPHILASDFEQGFMLLSDLGSTVYLDVIDESNAQPMMLAALDSAIAWQQASRPDVLPAYDEALLRREMGLFPEWYLGRHLGQDVNDPKLQATLESVFAPLVRSALAQPQVFVHRDFMPRNLMVATPQPGVLDFQDAVYGPIAYDVVSLFRDAFVSWEEALELDCVARYWERARKAGLPVRDDFAEFYREYEWMGLQRHLKVLGIFARLWYRDRKPRYLADTPRFTAYARKVAQRYRELAPLARLLDQIEGRVAEVAYTF
jgi:aminoglycoside/choline kinase family phosphotransferase